MKKYLVLLLLISFCGGATEETVSSIETTTTFSTTSTTTTVPKTTSTIPLSQTESFELNNTLDQLVTNETWLLFDADPPKSVYPNELRRIEVLQTKLQKIYLEVQITNIYDEQTYKYQEKYCQDYSISNCSLPYISDEHSYITTTTIGNSEYLSNYLTDYTLYDTEFGTNVEVTISNDIRIIVSNAIPNHRTGNFPNPGNPHTISEQNKIWNYPLNGVYTGAPKDVREPGVALNGVKFEPGTAETVTCNTGEVYKVEGLQQDYPLGMDINNAHVQPSGEYHYHGVSQLLIDVFSNSNDLVLIGFAQDGFLIYYSKSNKYKSSYQLSSTPRKGTNCKVSLRNQQELDLEGTMPNGTYTEDWNFVTKSGVLDECNGTFIDNQYAYIVTNEYPYFPRCLMGEFTEQPPGRNRRP